MPKENIYNETKRNTLQNQRDKREVHITIDGRLHHDNRSILPAARVFTQRSPSTRTHKTHVSTMSLYYLCGRSNNI